jgi:type II restriction enzyme
MVQNNNIMTFEDVLKIYEDEKLKNPDSFSFVKNIFAEVKEKYKEKAAKIGKDANQSWNSWSGHNLEKLITHIVKDYILTIEPRIGIVGDNELRKTKLNYEHDRIRRNVEIFYKKYSILPDADIIIYDRSNCNVIAILSCKASLRERVAQAAYWKVKLQSSQVTEGILYYLVSTDNDGDFVKIGEDIERNRIIVEEGEIDGAYIFRDDVPESDKVKHFHKLFDDLKRLFQRYLKQR